MVKIIKGTYGHYNGNKVIPITEKDGPQSFSEEVEARLVKKGVAVYVSEADIETVEKSDMPEYNVDMKLAELKEIAAAYGVDASKAKAKKDVIAMIEAAKNGNDEDTEDDADEDDGVVDDGEAPPSVNAAMPE